MVLFEGLHAVTNLLYCCGCYEVNQLTVFYSSIEYKLTPKTYNYSKDTSSLQQMSKTLKGKRTLLDFGEVLEGIDWGLGTAYVE